MARFLSCRLSWTVFSVILLCSWNTPAMAGDQPEFRFHADSNEVQLNFSVSDQNEHGIATLQATDFVVVDRDIVVRNFQSFSRSHWTQLQLAILLDTSESVTHRFRQEIDDSLDLISRTGGVPEENIFIVSFHNLQPELVCAGNCRASRAANKLATMQASGFTPLFDAIVFASHALAEHGDSKSRRVLIVFSDGNDTISRSSLADAIDQAQADDTEIYCVDVNTSAPSHGTGVLYSLSGSTGARYFSAPGGPARALDLILEDFRATYTVTYRLPSHAAGFHQIRVLPTRNLNLHFRSRSGYYYPNHTR